MSDQEHGPNSLGLLQQQVAKPVDPEQLQLFGKKAAALYCQGTSLNDAVVEVVKEATLAPEQIKRVCEFANTDAYLQAFEKSGEARNVTFDGGPADPSVVIKELNDGSAPAVHQVDNDYAPPSGSFKTASADLSVLADAFGHDGMEKAASADHGSHADPVDDLYDTKVRIEGVHDTFMSKMATSQVVMDDIKADLCHEVKQAMAEGATLGDVSAAWAAYTPSANMLKEAMGCVRDHLREGGMQDVQQANSLMKRASAGTIPNPEHPLVDKFIVFTKVAEEHHKLQHAIDISSEQVSEAEAALRKMLS